MSCQLKARNMTGGAMHGLLSEAKNGRYSSISQHMTEDDMFSVWENVSSFIQKQMVHDKGVQLLGFGSFTFTQKKLDIGNNKFILMQRPVFNISEQFARLHALQYTKFHSPGQIPVVPLNYSALSFESPFDRDTVESCVKEILSTVSRGVAAKRNIELQFSGIGKLTIRENKVKMKFYKEFVHQMDGSGTLVDSMQNRPGTSDSVMSDRCDSRTASRNTLVLPQQSGNMRISRTNTNLAPITETQVEEGADNPPYLDDAAPLQTDVDLPPINENTLQEPVQVTFPNPTQQPYCPPKNDDYTLGAPSPGNSGDPLGPYTGPNNGDNPPVAPSPQRTNNLGHYDGSTHRHYPPGVLAAAIAEDRAIEKEERIMNNDPNPVAVAFTDLAVDNIMAQTERKDDEYAMFPRPVAAMENHSRSGSVRNASRMSMSLPKASGISLYDDLQVPQGRTSQALTPLNAKPMSGLRSPLENKPASAGQADQFGMGITPTELTTPDRARQHSANCGHHHSGQELCYLCHQRSRTNVPVSFTNERRRREDEEDRLLNQYQSMKDAEKTLEEQGKLWTTRQDLQKTAAFNLGVADAVKHKKKSRDIDLRPSYIFQRRPLTPPRFPKQQEYFGDLAKQVDNKEQKRQKRMNDDQFLDRMEQVQLAEDLASQREQYLRDKQENRDMYKRALDTQLRYKPVPLPNGEPDFQMFGMNDMNNAKMADRRTRAHALFREQQEYVAQKKREAILQRLTEQQKEQEMLQRTKEEIIEERANRHRTRFSTRRRLEDDWQKATNMKKERELDEKNLSKLTGNLVHEQCDKYHRCLQCQKSLTNCGETNIWSESRYIPGTRLMV